MKRIAVFVCAALCVAVGAFAQTNITTGTIQGMVLDPQGAVVPGAEVEVRNLDTNLKRTFTTGPDGRFVFLQLPPGRYRVGEKSTDPTWFRAGQQPVPAGSPENPLGTRWIAWITWATVKVLPLPVIPSSTCAGSLRRMPAISSSMARG